MSKLIDVLVVKPGEHPFIEKVKNNFDAIRKFIGGIIDTLTLEEVFDDDVQADIGFTYCSW